MKSAVGKELYQVFSNSLGLPVQWAALSGVEQDAWANVAGAAHLAYQRHGLSLPPLPEAPPAPSLVEKMADVVAEKTLKSVPPKK